MNEEQQKIINQRNKSLAKKQKRLIRERDEKQREVQLIQDFLDGKMPDAMLAYPFECNEPVIVRPGDEVYTKYGEEMTVESIDVGRDEITLIKTVGEDGEPLLIQEHKTYGSHRIAHLRGQSCRHFLEEAWEEEMEEHERRLGEAEQNSPPHP